MAGDASAGAVWMALIGNGFLTILKFVAFAFSGSGAMFSEAIHSLADTANQGLLAVGIRRSRRPADALFPYGFGGERYLFALLSAVGIFVLGCGVTVYHGIHLLMHPAELNLAWYVFAVLGISLVVDGFVFWKALDAAHKMRGDQPVLAYLRGSSDPTVAAVLLEDGVACIGVIIALAASAISAWTQSALPDALATLTIGGMMGFVAIWLGVKNRDLIVGRAIPAPLQQQILDYLEQQPTVECVRNVRSRVVGAGTYRYKADIDWCGRGLAEHVTGWVEARTGPLDTPEARLAFAGDLSEELMQAQGREIDRIETELRERFPELQYLDFESE